jgi:hypothetical protein
MFSGQARGSAEAADRPAGVPTESPHVRVRGADPFLYNTDGSPIWIGAVIAGPGTTFSAPAMVRSGSATEITAEGP